MEFERVAPESIITKSIETEGLPAWLIIVRTFCSTKVSMFFGLPPWE